MTKTQAKILTALALFLFAVGIYLPTLTFQFTLDDYSHLVSNPKIKTLAGTLTSAFEPLFPGNLFRPSEILSYGLTYYFIGLGPYWYHLTNIILHGLVVLLVFRLLLEVVELLPAAFGSLIFSLHPVQVEVVSNVSHRSEMLSAMFILITIICALKSRSNRVVYFVQVAFFSFLALISKESAGVLLILLPLCLWLTRRPKELLPICLIAFVVSVAIYLPLRFNALGGYSGLDQAVSFIDNPLVELSIPFRSLNGVLNLGRYFLLILGPWQLSADYSYNHLPFVSSIDVHTFTIFSPEIIALVVLILGLFQVKTNKNYLAFFSAWFFGSFFITANIFFSIGTIFAERLLYLPSIGAIGFIVSLIWTLTPRKFASIILTAVSVILLLKTVTQELVWRNQTTLWSYQIETSPDSAKTQSNYGVVLRNEGRLDDASVHFRQALQIYSDFSEPAFGLATVYFDKGVRSGAYHWLHQALDKNSNFGPALVMLGKMYLEEDKQAQATQSFERAVAINPDDFEANLGLLASAVNRRDLEKAQALLRKLRAVDSHHPKLVEIEHMLAQLG